jgi:hypothetical protein
MCLNSLSTALSSSLMFLSELLESVSLADPSQISFLLFASKMSIPESRPYTSRPWWSLRQIRRIRGSASRHRSRRKGCPTFAGRGLFRLPLEWHRRQTASPSTLLPLARLLRQT